MIPYAQKSIKNQKHTCCLILLMTAMVIGSSILFMLSLGEYGEFSTLSYIALGGIICGFLRFAIVGFMGVRRLQRIKQNFYNQIK